MKGFTWEEFKTKIDEIIDARCIDKSLRIRYIDTGGIRDIEDVEVTVEDDCIVID